MTIKNIVHTTTYEKNGEQKKKYTTVGTLFVYDDGGMSIKLGSIPVNFDGKLAVYDRDNKQQQPQPQQTQQSHYASPTPSVDNDDEIPF